jgi:2-(3-amino-3-carboxypropyl)histidine synthase
MGDITYGACCVDDFTASMLGAQLLVHYGHSCLVPTTVANRIDTIYVFVTIDFNVEASIESIQSLLHSEGLRTRSSNKMIVEEEKASLVKVSLVSTIQFANSLAAIKIALEQDGESNKASGKKIQVNIPRSKPLSSGEILGCTAPKVDDDVIIYVGDGRFHLEAMMMANPSIPAYR